MTQQLKTVANNEETVPACKLLMTYFSNIMSHMEDPKYYRIPKANKTFESKVAISPLALEMLKAAEFVESDAAFILQRPTTDEESQITYKLFHIFQIS